MGKGTAGVQQKQIYMKTIPCDFTRTCNQKHVYEWIGTMASVWFEVHCILTTACMKNFFPSDISDLSHVSQKVRSQHIFKKDPGKK